MNRYNIKTNSLQILLFHKQLLNIDIKKKWIIKLIVSRY